MYFKFIKGRSYVLLISGILTVPKIIRSSLIGWLLTSTLSVIHTLRHNFNKILKDEHYHPPFSDRESEIPESS